MKVKLSRSAEESGFVPVRVDPAKIPMDWEINNSRLERVKDYINNVCQTGRDDFELPEAWFSTVKNSLMVLNGRHRISELVRRKADLWIAVPEGQAEMISERYGLENREPVLDRVDENYTSWAQGDFPNPDGEVKYDGPGVMPQNTPTESMQRKPPGRKGAKASAPKLSNKKCGESFIPDHEICHEEEVKPEKVVAAAIKVNGKTYTGPMHVFAAIAAHAAGEFPGMQDLNGLEDVKHLIEADGFLTSHGRFITREDAFELAQKNGQMQKTHGFHGAGRLGSEDLNNVVAIEYERLNNAKGKPCGKSFIPEDEKCHVGEVEISKFGTRQNIKVGRKEFTAKIVPKFDIPEKHKDRLSMVPENAIYAEFYDRKMVIDPKAGVVHHILDDERAYTESAHDNPNELEYKKKETGSIAWADANLITDGDNGAFDLDMVSGHKSYETADKGKTVEQLVDEARDREHPGIGSVMRWAAKFEAAAMAEPVQPIQWKEKNHYPTLTPKIEAKLQGKTRKEAIEYLNKEIKKAVQAEHRKAIKYNEEVDRKEAEKGEPLSGPEKAAIFERLKVSDNRDNAMRSIRRRIVDQIADRLVPKYQNTPAKPEIESSLDPVQTERLTQRISDAHDWLSSHLHPKVYEHLSRGRPKFELREMQGKERAFYTPEKIVLSKDNGTDTVIHEYGHHVGQSARADYLGSDFLHARTLDGLFELKRLTGNSAYEPHEVAKRDRFVDPYVGKIYTNSNTEVISMGLQHMSSDPGWFYRADREHFLLTAFVMHGGGYV